jgi:DNA-binding NarL/FixJ family response regulator
VALTTSTTHLAADPIRVMVADARGADRLVCRIRLGQGDAFAVVAEAVEAGQAVAVAAFEQPDVVILDPDLPNPHGVDVLADLAARAPRVRVVMRADRRGDDFLHARVRRAFARPA